MNTKDKSQEVPDESESLLKEPSQEEVPLSTGESIQPEEEREQASQEKPEGQTPSILNILDGTEKQGEEKEPGAWHCKLLMIC